MKPYQQVPISDCGEPLVPIPIEQFAVEQPHPYVKLGAPYGNRSPYYLRQGVLDALCQAQELLQRDSPNWRIQLFDAYRPLAVQQFMVDHTFAQAVQERGLIPEQLTESEQQSILEQVYQFWAVPSYDPATPPPHSTGAAVDVTLVDAEGQAVDMGSPIDEMSARSFPDYFDSASHPVSDYALNSKEQESESQTAILLSTPYSRFHENRQILKRSLIHAGFRQHPNEWWHFSLGDQLWAWLVYQDHPDSLPIARYGSF
jgi:zinc D-Ala-D-Ala dipeptidase